ncbi:MAG: hypothetical protein GY768_11280 [Planctomycetaceae bacterium]|nr:hypothetical protein [Planctomycetaceae bacterium]
MKLPLVIEIECFEFIQIEKGEVPRSIHVIHPDTLTNPIQAAGIQAMRGLVIRRHPLGIHGSALAGQLRGQGSVWVPSVVAFFHYAKQAINFNAGLL